MIDFESHFNMRLESDSSVVTSKSVDIMSNWYELFCNGLATLARPTNLNTTIIRFLQDCTKRHTLITKPCETIVYRNCTTKPKHKPKKNHFGQPCLHKFEPHISILIFLMLYFSEIKIIGTMQMLV